MSQEQEQPTPIEKSSPVRRGDTSMLPFDINDYRPAEPDRSPLARFGRRSSSAESFHLPGTTQSPGILGTMPRLLLTVVVLLILVFGIIRVGVWALTSQAAYPGVNQCYRIELWLHEVSIDVTRIQWALADAEEQVTNEAEADEANERIWQMFVDMRTSIANRPVPVELTELRMLWIEYIDLGLEGRELNRQGKTEERAVRLQRQEEVLVQRNVEERRVRDNCRLANFESGPNFAVHADAFLQPRAVVRTAVIVEDY